MTRRELVALSAIGVSAPAVAQGGKLRAGCATVDITPPLGTSLAGAMQDIRSTEVHDELRVKAVVLDDGRSRIALGLVDTCVLPGSAGAEAKRLIVSATGMEASHIAFAATHTHSGGTMLHLFQSQPSPGYVEFVTRRMADAVRMAVSRLQPAKLGFAFGREERIAFNRRYFMREGTVPPNPFGGADRVRTNPGAGNPDIVKPAGPIDPTVGVLAVQAMDGTPIAVVGNYSLHYVGGQPNGHVSADYFAFWAASMRRRLGVRQGPGETPFAAMLFNGCQGNINNIDTRQKAERKPPYAQMAAVAEVLADESARVLGQVRYTGDVELSASEEWLELGVRLPSSEDVAAAKKRIEVSGEHEPFRQMPLIYARETLLMADSFPAKERVPVQVLRVGRLALSLFPGEPFVELGLETRAKSPFGRNNFLVGLANAAAGYIPTEEAHAQGGYETWRAKSSYLERTADAKITRSMLRQLEAVAL